MFLGESIADFTQPGAWNQLVSSGVCEEINRPRQGGQLSCRGLDCDNGTRLSELSQDHHRSGTSGAGGQLGLLLLGAEGKEGCGAADTLPPK